MQFKVFDVIELEDGKRATIIKIDDNIITGEIIDDNGKSLGVKEIEKERRTKIIFRNCR